jgi:hypothetical protein
MMISRRRSLIGAAAMVMGLTAVGDAGAAFRNMCSAGKEACVAVKVTGLLMCHTKAERRGDTVDPSCLQKAAERFDGGSDPARGCFARSEAKPPCFTILDTAMLEVEVDGFVLDVVAELDPGYPAPVENRCSALKKQCVAKKVAGLLTCYSKDAAIGHAVHPLCLSRVQAKFAHPSTGCFARVEAKYAGSCLTSDDTAALEAKVDAFVLDVVSELAPRCGDNTATVPYEECDGVDDTACPGLCRPPGDPNECQCR